MSDLETQGKAPIDVFQASTCDQNVPTCTQCIRKRIPCSGYRDVSAPRWRDETARVGHKVQRAKQKGSHCGLDSPARSDVRIQGAKTNVALSSWQEGNLPHSPVALPPKHLKDVALDFFMCSFIYASPFDTYLPQLYGVKHSTQAVLPAIHAAAFATFAQRTRDDELMKKARSSYATALLHTNKSLSSPKNAVLDETLVSVLLLGLFEAIVFKGGQSPESWTAHTLGAVHLLRLRRADQFRSKTARQLFTQTITNIRTSCIQRRVPVPQEFLDLVQEASPYLDSGHPCIQIGPVLDQAATLRSRVEAGVVHVIHAALEVDQGAIDLCERIKPNMRFTPKIPGISSKWAYLKFEYDYLNRRHAKVWNTIRMIRIFMNKTIWVHSNLSLQHTFQPGETEHSSDLYSREELLKFRDLATNNLLELETDLLRSVSCFLEPDSLGGKFCTSARCLIWPLTVLAQSELSSLSAREHAVSCLYQIGEDLNMEQAISAAKMTGEMNKIEDWLHLYHL
ncbi:unnamed protein product [Clonostachys rosea]|uniref:Zn(2)-C6 fungal-type domain-containing protein n=1 Tax=Bionectria ochroleuca TaxID=29856 RepID=A0ABY6TVR1_BIOOC|nr:unnamed protein product [Clonostachys rosea]